MSVLCWGLQSWMWYSRLGLTKWSREGESPPSTCWSCFFLCSLGYEWLDTCWTASMRCWLMSNFLPTSIPKSFLVGLLSIHSLPSLYWYWGLPWPRCRTLHLALLTFMRFTLAQSSSLSGSRWMATLRSRVSTASHSLLSSAKLLRVHSIPLSMSLMMILNITLNST